MILPDRHGNPVAGRLAADRRRRCTRPRKLSGKRTASDRALWRVGCPGSLAEGQYLRQTDRGGVRAGAALPSASSTRFPEICRVQFLQPPRTEVHRVARMASRGADGSYTIGITAHAQDELGELVYVELPDVGRKLAKEEACCVVESTKAASDVYAPIAGEVVAVNDALRGRAADRQREALRRRLAVPPEARQRRRRRTACSRLRTTPRRSRAEHEGQRIARRERGGAVRRGRVPPSPHRPVGARGSRDAGRRSATSRATN